MSYQAQCPEHSGPEERRPLPSPGCVHTDGFPEGRRLCLLWGKGAVTCFHSSLHTHTPYTHTHTPLLFGSIFAIRVVKSVSLQHKNKVSEQQVAM